MNKIGKSLSICGCLLLIVFFNKCNFGDDKNKPVLYVIEIKQMQFQPALLKIHPGDTVVWLNHDFVAHDKTEEHKAWNSSPLTAGASWKMAANKSAGYYCSIHQVRKGKLIVE